MGGRDVEADDGVVVVVDDGEAMAGDGGAGRLDVSAALVASAVYRQGRQEALVAMKVVLEANEGHLQEHL